VSYGIGSTTRQPIDPGPNLRRNGATPEEVAFIRGQREYGGYHGQRVELNAFTSRQLVDWINACLTSAPTEQIEGFASRRISGSSQ
jgi:hypothetical protein